jgi:hypothetical protein
MLTYISTEIYSYFEEKASMCNEREDPDTQTRSSRGCMPEGLVSTLLIDRLASLVHSHRDGRTFFAEKY